MPRGERVPVSIFTIHASTCQGFLSSLLVPSRSLSSFLGGLLSLVGGPGFLALVLHGIYNLAHDERMKSAVSAQRAY